MFLRKEPHKPNYASIRFIHTRGNKWVETEKLFCWLMNTSWIPHSAPGSFIYVISVKYSQEFYVIDIVTKGDMEAHIGEKSVQDQQLASDRARILTWSKLLPFMECFFMG